LPNHAQARAFPRPAAPARLLALAFMLFCVALFLAGSAGFLGYAAENPEQFTTFDWPSADMEAVIARLGLTFSGYLQAKLVLDLLSGGLLSAVGLIIFLRKPDDWFAFFLAVNFVLYATLSGSAGYVLTFLHPAWSFWLVPLTVMAWLAFFLLIFLFPNGRFVPRWNFWVAGVLTLIYLWIILFNAGQQPPTPWLLLAFGLIGVGAASQVYRYRRVSTLVERQQTKWVILALLILFAALLFLALPTLIPGLTDPAAKSALFWVLYSNSVPLIVSLVPLSIAFAILRYRLFDIDLIIRRALVYGLLTFLLAAVYFGSVIVLQQVFRSLIGQETPAVVVLSTLAIAGLAAPLRRRLQAGIDRRFFRRKYSAEQALAQFSQDMRSQLDRAAIAAEMIQVARESLEPESIALWVTKEPGREIPAPAYRL
jgi:hypothetical protein